MFSFVFIKYRDVNNKDILKWQIFWVIYVLFLMGLLTILGGQSSSGIALDNVIVLIVLIISLFQIYSRWKKVKTLEE